MKEEGNFERGKKEGIKISAEKKQNDSIALGFWSQAASRLAEMTRKSESKLIYERHSARGLVKTG